MATPAANTPLRLVSPAGDGEAGELVPVAFLGRTSTADMQDPRASLSRQLRAARAWLPAGWFVDEEKLIREGVIDMETGLAYATNPGNLQLDLSDLKMDAEEEADPLLEK